MSIEYHGKKEPKEENVQGQKTRKKMEKELQKGVPSLEEQYQTSKEFQEKERQQEGMDRDK